MTIHGERTEDLRKSDPAKLPDDETRTRRFGHRMLWIGGVSIPIVYLFCLTAAVLTGNKLWRGTDGPLFSVLGLMTLIAGASAAILVGGFERILRPMRDRQRDDESAHRAATDRNRILLERLILDVEEKYRNMLDLIAPLPGRLSAIEEAIVRVPDYGRGVIDGMQVRADALGQDSDRDQH